MKCETYWGSHGCDLERYHKGDHECDCCECEDHEKSNMVGNVMCVAKYPYYGENTQFYGADAGIIDI